MNRTIISKSIMPAGLLLAGSLFASQASAIVVLGGAPSWGTAANSGTIGCITAGCPGGGVFPPGSLGTEEDALYDPTASTTVSDTEGSAEAHVQLLSAGGSVNLPKFTGQAFSSNVGSNGNGGASRAEAWALDGFMYSGPAANVTFTMDLTGTFSGPTSGEDSNLDGIFGTMRIFTDPSGVDEITFETEGNLSPRLFCLFECYLPDETADVHISDGSSLLTNGFTVALNPGDTFYLYTSFFIGAAGGGQAISMSSLDVSVSSTAGLTSASAGVVPVPAAVWLFGSGLLGLVGVARRRS